MIPPSRLPSWKEFNTLLLECLCERLDDYSRERQPTARILEAFKSRRDDAKLLAPDFQAQLMEEEVGTEYFAVWQSIDTPAFGPIHAALAELAARDRLAAIVTTNFDRLIEIAMKDRGVEYRAYHDSAGFEQLASAADTTKSPLPIVKIHGSIEDAPSLVDTLRQRMVGRPPALNAALRRLLERVPWVFIGWSGADLNHNRHYLGIRDALELGTGLVFTRRRGDPIEPGVASLIEDYQRVAPGKAEALEIDGAVWLAETFGLPAWSPPVEAESDPQARVNARVKENIHKWVDRLGPVAVVNIICAMLRSSGLDREAWWLLRKTFKSYRTPDDTKGSSYHRYNYNYGVALLESGFIRNPVALADDMSNLPEWKTNADQNGFEFLCRAYKDGGLLPAGGALAALRAYRGEIAQAMNLASTVADKAIEREAWVELCDIAADSAVIYDIVQMFTPAVQQVELSREKATLLGDEPRRALLCAHLGRFLTYAGEFDKADARLKEAEQIASDLGLVKVEITARAARGIWLHDSGTSPSEAFAVLQRLAMEIQADQEQPLVVKVNVADDASPPTVLKARQPMLCRVLLDLISASLSVRDSRAINHALDLLDELTVEHFSGYVPHYYFCYAQCLLLFEPPDPQRALELIQRARKVGEANGNPWVSQYADHLEPHARAALAKCR